MLLIPLVQLPITRLHTYTSCYVDVHSTVVPYSPPVAVPEYNVIGLLALIGILTIALAFATLRRKR